MQRLSWVWLSHSFLCPRNERASDRNGYLAACGCGIEIKRNLTAHLDFQVPLRYRINEQSSASRVGVGEVSYGCRVRQCRSSLETNVPSHFYLPSLSLPPPARRFTSTLCNTYHVASVLFVKYCSVLFHRLFCPFTLSKIMFYSHEGEKVPLTTFDFSG